MIRKLIDGWLMRRMLRKLDLRDYSELPESLRVLAPSTKK